MAYKTPVYQQLENDANIEYVTPCSAVIVIICIGIVIAIAK